MRAAKAFALVVGLLGLLALPPQAAANVDEYTLEFIPTQNAPAGAQGTMTIKVDVDKPTTEVLFKVRGVYPNTVYTIWIVYNILTWTPDDPNNLTSAAVGSSSASSRPEFPLEGSPVAPLARLDSGFTSGMGLDPGAAFITDEKGDGQINVKVDYNLVNGEPDGAPLGNKDIIVQCAPTPSNCLKKVSVTTTWLRRYVGAYPLDQRATMCANYDPRFDPDVTLDPAVRKGMDARLWQCVDPATVDSNTGNGMPRVYRYQFDHFRLANHPDDLTHGYIGGDKADHWIDMVGRYADLQRSDGASVSAAASTGRHGPKIKVGPRVVD